MMKRLVEADKSSKHYTMVFSNSEYQIIVKVHDGKPLPHDKYSFSLVQVSLVTASVSMAAAKITNFARRPIYTGIERDRPPGGFVGKNLGLSQWNNLLVEMSKSAPSLIQSVDEADEGVFYTVWSNGIYEMTLRVSTLERLTHSPPSTSSPLHTSRAEPSQ